MTASARVLEILGGPKVLSARPKTDLDFIDLMRRGLPYRALKVTTAQYLTPNGRDINKKGIAPDVVAPDDPNTPSVDETVQKALDLIAAGSSGK